MHLEMPSVSVVSAAVDAVADLFGNIPISGYLAMNMGAIPTMNDAVGGVKVKVLQNISYPDYNVKLHKGDKVTLNGTGSLLLS